MGGRSDAGVPRIDRPILEAIRDRLQTARQFEDVSIRTARGQLRLEVRFDPAVDPPELERRVLDVRWYTNDDFRINYLEEWPDRTWTMRWDRHPNPRNDRDHFHPPPGAATPGHDRTWPPDYRDVLELVVSDLHDRTEELWDRTE